MVYQVDEWRKFCVAETGSLSLNMSYNEIHHNTDERSKQMEPVFLRG